MIRTKKIVLLDFLGDLLSLASCWYFIISLFPMLLSLLEAVHPQLPSPLADQLNCSGRLLGDDTDPSIEGSRPSACPTSRTRT
jgi:hypothetical protein